MPKSAAGNPKTQLFEAMAESLVARIRPMLNEQHLGVQGAEFAELVAGCVVGHRPDLRERVFNDLIALTRQFVSDMDPAGQGLAAG
jgi:hypothetical protein